MDKNSAALALAYRRAKGKKLKIRELEKNFNCDFTDLSQEKKNEIIESMAMVKALESDTEMTQFVKGQAWYVDTLEGFACLSTKEQLDYEYNSAFADTASEDEMLAQLEAL